MRIKRWIVLSLAAALATLMLTGCPWDQDRPGGGASSQPGGDGVIVVPPGGDDDDDGDDPPVTYTITATAGPGGTAQPPAQTVAAGQNASVAVAASDGYCIRQITVDGDARFTAADASRTEYTVQFPAVDASHTVEASFAQVYTVTASIGEGGTVKLGDQSVADGDSAAFLADDTLTFTVEPDSGYQIASVQAGGDVLSGENGSYTYTVKGDCTISVTFQKLTYTVTATVSGTGGKVSVSSEKVEHGGSVTVTVTPDGGYIVDSVQDNDTDVTDQVTNNTYTLANVTASHTIIVTFKLENPDTYPINSREDFIAWADEASSDPSLSCTLYKDILLPGDWTPIGTDNKNPYTGTFDGNGHTISGLNVTGNDNYAGLFGYIGKDGTVKNVKLEKVQITSDYQYAYVGGVAGYSEGTIENCSVSGSVSGNGSSSNVGGVVGLQFGGSITGCSSSAPVKGSQRVGGVAGATNYGATLTACYSTGNVTLESNGSDNYSAGGVVGTNQGSSTLTNCYATGNVSGTGSGTGPIYVGGVVGFNPGTVTCCYHATGIIYGPEGTTGGVAGRNSGTVTKCYWTSNPDRGIGEDETGNGETTKVDDDWTYSPR